MSAQHARLRDCARLCGAAAVSFNVFVVTLALAPFARAQTEEARLERLELRARLERLLKEKPEDTDAALRLTGLLLLDGETSRATELARRLLREGALAPRRDASGDKGLAEACEAVLSESSDRGELPAVAGLRASGDLRWSVLRALALARSGETARAAAAFEALAAALRRGAGLGVKKVRLVRRVEGFGLYEEDERESFSPGESLLVYAELSGFLCRPEGEAWKTKLEVGLALESSSGRVVGSWGPEEVEHVTRSELRDLYLTRLLHLPGKIGPGRYEMKFAVKDSGSGEETFGLLALRVGRRAGLRPPKHGGAEAGASSGPATR